MVIDIFLASFTNLIKSVFIACYNLNRLWARLPFDAGFFYQLQPLYVYPFLKPFGYSSENHGRSPSPDLSTQAAGSADPYEPLRALKGGDGNELEAEVTDEQPRVDYGVSMQPDIDVKITARP